jgi:hypothetical protein
MSSVMSHPSERQVAVSAIKLWINHRWIASEFGKPLPPSTLRWND